MLAAQADPLTPGYRALNEKFERDPREFFPAVAADPRIEQLKAELLAMQRSLSWRITAPLRRLRRLVPGR
jgi:hypothetical protein